MISLGVLSIGPLAIGGFALGALALGYAGYGGMAIGGFVAGGLAAGYCAYGGVAFAIQAARGGLAWSLNYAEGGLAIGRLTDGAAVDAFFSQHWFFQLIDPALKGEFPQWLMTTFWIGIAIVVVAQLLLSRWLTVSAVPETVE